MTNERKLELFEKMLDFIIEELDSFECDSSTLRYVGFTDEEIKELHNNYEEE